MPGSRWLQAVFLLALTATGCRSAVIEMGEEEWSQLLTGEWMIEFYAPWCPACRALQPTWKEFGTWDHDLGLDGIASVDVTQAPGLSGRFMVTALPTIYHVKDGEFRQYRGSREKDSLISFIEDKKWKEIEPVSAWKHPNSIQMSVVSSFFKLSMVLRNVHTSMTEEYGLPSWASYLSFAVATIIIGALLGLVLVLCIDCFFPTKSIDRRPVQVSQPKARDSEDEGCPEDDDMPDDRSERESEESSDAPDEQQAVRLRKGVRRDD